MRVLWLTNIPSPYRVDFFNELGRLCDLTVTFEKSASDERDEEWKKYKFNSFNGIILKGVSISTDMAFCPGIIKHIKEKTYDVIVVSDLSSLTGMLAVQYMIMHSIAYWIEGDGGFAKTGYGVKEKLKKHFISHACGYFSTSKVHDDYYIAYGADANKIVRYPFSSIGQKELDETISLFKEGRGSIRKAAKKSIGLTSDKSMVLFIGQFIYRKGVDILMKVAAETCRTLNNVVFCLIGGTLDEELSAVAKELPEGSLLCLPFMSRTELKPFFLAADCFVLPTREDIWGLVINEAMAMGLPVITTDRCVAGLELVGVENGRLIQADDPAALSEALQIILRNEELNLSMAEESLKRIQPYTIENMARVHLETFQNAVGK